ncbi:NIPSNAP family protein [Paraburkholderia sp. LEh10]|uniref:NIPSNAP family protein n=1 Tax=Paraburkholderia sp. LEh10 TaxID=2821353 RepID=UPI001AEAC80F|nr:NIPSNAP family protein [Paraburkholderia sp. LEh10]MBP0592260.1 NIPSNAP family protein [Paraburkholderia sp. LEh10]
MTLYDTVTLTVKIGTNAQVFEGIQASGNQPGSTLLGCWYSDIGALGKVMVLRGFESEAALVNERKRLLLEGNPFRCGEFIDDVQAESYALFPFLPPIEPAVHGGIYETRVYGTKLASLQHTIDAWEKAVPERTKRSRLVGAMYSLDGNVPRFLNIWPYASVDERSRVRAQAVKDGIWPPKGGPAHLTTMESTIYMPAPFSPLR